MYTMCVCVCACTHVLVSVSVCLWYMWRSKNNLRSWFSLSTFVLVLGIKLRSAGLHSQRLYLLNHLFSPVNPIYPASCPWFH